MLNLLTVYCKWECCKKAMETIILFTYLKRFQKSWLSKYKIQFSLNGRLYKTDGPWTLCLKASMVTWNQTHRFTAKLPQNYWCHVASTLSRPDKSNRNSRPFPIMYVLESVDCGKTPKLNYWLKNLLPSKPTLTASRKTAMSQIFEPMARGDKEGIQSW